MPAARLETTRVTPLVLPSGASDRRPRQASRGPCDGRNEAVYYAGPENALVAATVSRLLSVATGDDAPFLAGPTTLVGPPGCGKSLLATGVVAAWRASQGDDAVLAMSGVDLRRQLERAIAADREKPGLAASLGDRLAGVRLLVIENLEGAAPSPSTVELITATIERLADSGGRLIVTAGKPLSEIAGLDARVVTRLAEGLTLEVAAPGLAVRHELLAALLAARSCRIEPAAAADLAGWLPADARRVLAVADSLHQRFGARTLIGRNEVRSYIADATAEEASTPLADIAAVVARYYAMPLRQLRSSSRKAPIVLARAVAIYLARQLTPLSYEEIGRYLGGRDHTTVMHNYNRIDKRATTDRALRSAIEDLLRRLGRTDTLVPPLDTRGGAR